MPARQQNDTHWTMTEDAWSKELVPIPNLFKEAESWNVNPVSIKGCCYDPHNEKDMAFIQSVNPENIWTLYVNDDEEEKYDKNGDPLPTPFYILSGLHVVNRQAYFVTCVSLEEYLGEGKADNTIEIKIDW